ncbi:hypothetical protein B0919_06330 [Hymenobacter sp. CRA2]|nr:hypothetical protein B0919_06330 [Hymenobacter sp. CRA2]
MLLALALTLGACSHDDAPAPLSVTASTDPNAAPTIEPSSSAVTPPTKPLDPAAAFDLDNALFLPTPPNAAPVPAPWAPGAPRAFGEDLAQDHRSADGWEVVFSSFSTRSLSASSHLLLYNKYRGVMRLYVLNANGTVSNRAVLASTAQLQGSRAYASPLLAFASQAVVDPDQRPTSTSTLEPQSLSAATWYATEIELAYDSNMRTYDFASLALGWKLVSAEVADVRLGGTATGNSLPVAIQAPEVDFAGRGTYDGPAEMRLTGSGSVAALQQANLPTEAARNVLAQAAGTNWYRGLISQQPGNAGSLVYLPTQARVSVAADVLVASNSFALPGYDNTTVTGSAPQYNAAPGVFFLAARPVVTTQSSSGGTYTYTLDAASVRYRFNPAVTAIADIRNVRQEIVAAAPNKEWDAPIYTGTTLTANQQLNVYGVRVAFDVVPRNGSAAVHISKTFKADLR